MKDRVTNETDSGGTASSHAGTGMAAERWIGGVLNSLALAAQRLPVRPPQAVRAVLRALLLKFGWYDSGKADVADWSKPLLINRPLTPGSCDHALESSAPPGNCSPPADHVVSRITEDEKESCGTNRVSLLEDSSLRCLLVTSSLDAGGMDEVVFFLANRFPHHRVRTAVLHASSHGSANGAPAGRLGRLLSSQGIDVAELGAAKGAEWLRSWQPDIVSSHGAPPWVLTEANSLSIPYVETLHGMHALFGRDPRAERERAQHLAGIVAVSELVRQQYLSINPAFSSERIVTIPNGVDDRRRMPGDRDRARAERGIQGEYIFLSLARHCLQKNTYGLVAAFADVAAQYPEAHLVIAGRPEDPLYFRQVMRLRERLPCRDRIHLRDNHPHPADLLAFADGFVLDSFFEGWSLASMEALYAGVPVVLSEVGGAREQIGDGIERGVLVPNPVGDPLQVNWDTIGAARFVRQVNRSALVEAMASLIENRAFWLSRRECLISESAMRFHPDVCLRKHVEFLKAVFNREPVPTQL